MSAAPLARSALAAYAAPALPLAMLALPVYVLLPRLWAETTGLALASIGAVLLATRLADALIDPWLGAWIDRAKARGSYWRPMLMACAPAACGFVLLFSPPAGLGDSAALVWLAATLLAATIGYSAATIAHQSWGAGLASDDAGRARVMAAREGVGLLGVLVASVLPFAAGMPALIAVFLLSLLLGMAWLARAPRPALAGAAGAGAGASLGLALRSRRLRWLLAVFVLNGIAAAVPATLVGFFIADRLGLAERTGIFLAAYFLAGALAMPLWVRLARAVPLELAWLLAMGLAVASFVWAAALGAGDFAGFLMICLVAGLALGADLAIPPALLARVLAADGAEGSAEGAYFGLWNFANKANLALAAGIALPVLGALGYAPGARSEPALAALAIAYAVVPSALKLAAAGLLLWCWRSRRF